MKIVIGIVLGLIVAFFPPSVMAKDLCFTETPVGGSGSLDYVFKAFTTPGKGTCKPVIAIVPIAPGRIESGAVCRTSDGKTLLFNLSWGEADAVGNQRGSITLASGSGSEIDYTVYGGGPFATGGTNTIAIDTCPKKPTPITPAPSDAQE